MSEIHYVQTDMGRVVELMDPAPCLFGQLVACMRIQPEIDPDAGYGAFQVPTLYFNLEWPVEIGEALACKLNHPQFYVLIRALYAAAILKEDVDQFLTQDKPLPFGKMLNDVQELVPSFGKQGVAKLI